MGEFDPSDKKDPKETIALPVLQTEYKTFEGLLPTLLETNPGEWALIKETELGGIYAKQMEAIHAGYEIYGNQPFLTIQILEEQPQHFYNFSEAA